MALRCARDTLAEPEPPLTVQLLEVAVDAPLAEIDAPLGSKVRFDPRALCHAIVQRDQAGNFLLETLHALGKGVAQSLDDLEEREVDIAQPAADQIFAAVLLQHALEIIQEFRHAITPEILGA